MATATMNTVNTTRGANSEPARSSQIYVQSIEQAASTFEPLAEQVRALQRITSASLAGSFEYATSFFEMLAAQSRMMRQLTAGVERVEQPFPQLELYEKQGGYIIDVRVPGFRREEIDIACRPNRITISGSAERKSVEDELEGPIYVSEFQRRFSRTIDLPGEVDPANVTAKLQDGLLSITLPTPNQTPAKRVPVTV